jgi:hypothetical protein
MLCSQTCSVRPRTPPLNVPHKAATVRHTCDPKADSGSTVLPWQRTYAEHASKRNQTSSNIPCQWSYANVRPMTTPPMPMPTHPTPCLGASLKHNCPSTLDTRPIGPAPKAHITTRAGACPTALRTAHLSVWVSTVGRRCTGSRPTRPTPHWKAQAIQTAHTGSTAAPSTCCLSVVAAYTTRACLVLRADIPATNVVAVR